MDTNTAEAIERLQSFFREMTQWEIDAEQVSDAFRSDPVHEPLRRRLADLQKKYCTPGAKFRGYKVSSPPTYKEMVIEDSEPSGKDKVIVKAQDQRGGLNDRYQFVLAKKAGQWMLSERIFLTHAGKREQFYF